MITSFVGATVSGGVRPAALGAAFERLEGVEDVEIVGVSHVYEFIGADPDVPTASAVARIETTLPAAQLAGWIGDISHEIEGGGFGGASVRLELLLFGDEEWSSASLVIPAPGLFERDSLVTPLLEVAPDAKLPDETYLHPDSVRVEHIIGELGPVPGFEGRRAVLADRLADESAARRAEARREGLPNSGVEEAWPKLAKGDDWATLLSVTETASWAWVRVTQGVIRAAGIPCVQTGMLAGERIGLWIPGAEPVRLLVPRSRLAEAHGVLARNRPEPLLVDDDVAWESDDIAPRSGTMPTIHRGAQQRELSPAAKRLGWAILVGIFLLVTMWGGWSR